MFNQLGDYWDDYDYKEVIETIWNSYDDLREEQKAAIEVVNQSKSIKTVPYEIKKKWKKIKFKIIDGQFHLLTEFEEVVTSIPIKVDGEYNIFDKDLIPLKIENDLNFEKEYKIAIVDMPFGSGEPYNPIEFRDMNNQPLGVDYFTNFIEDGIMEIWVEDYFVHNPLVYETFGELVGLNKGVFGLNKYSRKYYNMTVAMWYVLVNGPTIENIKIGIYLFYNLPLTLAHEAIIELWEPGHVKLSTGDEWYYKDDFTLIENYVDEDYNEIPVNGVGDVIPPFNFLVKGIEVKDYLSDPGWWKPMEYFDKDLDIEKHSTAFIEISGKAFGNQTRNLSILYDFLVRITPQFVNFEIFLVTNGDDDDYGQWPPGGGTGNWPGDDDGDTGGGDTGDGFPGDTGDGDTGDGWPDGDDDGGELEPGEPTPDDDLRPDIEGYDPGNIPTNPYSCDGENYDNFEPNNDENNLGEDDYDQGDDEDYGDGSAGDGADGGNKRKLDNGQATDYTCPRDWVDTDKNLFDDPWFEKDALAEIADRSINWGPVPDFHHTYALQDRYYEFDGYIKYDNMGDQLTIEIHENRTDESWPSDGDESFLKTLRNY
jgi:hypothetical protein